MSVSRDDVRQHLSRILAEEAQLLAELESVLERETDILVGDDAQAIQNIGSNRHRCVDALSRLGVERTDTGRMLCFGADATGLDQLFEWADPSKALHARWSVNLELARRCKAINDKNGAIVAAKLNRVQKLLGQLRGVNPAPVYSSRASRYASLGLRNLGVA
ncbi:MAG TPA: flagellar protein FlgN [Steroidobacteraceae bacterium]|jgi:flagellar biosynthesis/type III secretory pathway chaperone|nr:flagellar protein FlgN [Steroidobacteraceae bacterium]